MSSKNKEGAEPKHIQVLIKPPTGSFCKPVEISQDTQVSDLKERVCRDYRLEPEAVSMCFGGRTLDSCKKLFDYSITNDSTISLSMLLKAGMQITVKTLSGRQQNFSFEKTALVSEVKQALQEKEGIQVDQIRLIFSGRQLADDKRLEDYNVTPGATIHMVLQLRGG